MIYEICILVILGNLNKYHLDIEISKAGNFKDFLPQENNSSDNFKENRKLYSDDTDRLIFQ